MHVHAAGLDKPVVPREGLGEEVGGVLAVALSPGAVEVILEHGAVVGVRAAVDNQLRALFRREPAQVSQTLISDDDHRVVFGVIDVADHGNDA